MIRLNEKENIENMKKCPRWEAGCSIPQCPLDYWMLERTKLDGEVRCPLLMKQKSPKEKGIVISAGLKKLRKLVPTINQEYLR